MEGSDTEEVNEELDALEAAGIDISDLGIPFRGKRKNIFDDLCNFQWSLQTGSVQGVLTDCWR